LAVFLVFVAVLFFMAFIALLFMAFSEDQGAEKEVDPVYPNDFSSSN
jgi:hypothetical protein